MPDHVDDDYEWDIDKSESTYEHLGFDFEFASQLFETDAYRERLDEREYGEERVLSYGVVEQVHISVVWTQRGSRKRIISAFLSTKEDIIDYEQAFGWDRAWPFGSSQD